MTKGELVKALQDATSYNASQCAVFLDCLGNVMAAELLGGGDVSLPRIGKIVVRQAAARTGRNPRTGESVTIPAKKKLVLRVGREMKEALE